MESKYGEEEVKSESDQKMRRVQVARIDDLEEGRGHVVEVEGRRLALFTIDDQILCIDDRCPHAGGRLGQGKLCGSVVRCPRHGWRFDVVDGRCLSNPRYEVRRFEVEIDGREVFVRLPRFR